MKTLSEIDLLIVGDYCFDLIFNGLNNMPELGKEIVASGFDFVPGGAYNTVAACQHLNLNFLWACDFGTDLFSQLVLKKVKECGISEELFYFHDRSLRNITVACSYPGDRAFIAFYDPAPKIRAGIKALARVKAKWILIPGLFTGRLFDFGISIIRSTGSRVIMDGNSNIETNLSNKEIRNSLKAIDIFLPNETEVVRLTGKKDPFEGLIELSSICDTVIMKAGAKGAFTYQNGNIIHVPGIPVKPIDTTGAGDNFNAGFIKGLLEGKILIEAIRMGNIVGGLSTEILGGSGRMVTSEEIITWLEFYKG